jgi:penicillin amidase
MRRLASLVLILGASVGACSDSDSGSATGDLEWPPDATVYFDEHRVFHADCATDEDCAMALGYYHAFDRFVQMDVRRRFTTGRLGDILPKAFAEGYADDFADLRALFSTREGEPAEQYLYEQASPKTKSTLDAYAVGVNKWIEDMKNEENGATFPLEFTHPFLEYTPDKVPAWTPQDSVATVIALADELTNDESEQVAAGAARADINDDAKFSDLWSREPLEKSAILPPDWTPPADAAAAGALQGTVSKARVKSAGIIRQLNEKLKRIADLRQTLLGSGVEEDEIGSNNWVVGPSLTKDGNALLSNDPHLGMTQPATWYLAHLDAKTNGRGTMHVAGVTFAGIPWPLIGQNEDLAWGATTTVMDFSDVYLETLVTDGNGNPTGVMFKGEEVPFIRKTFTITFSDGTTEDKELLFVPHHGAVREITPEDGTAVTLRWTGNDIDTDINLFPAIAVATNIDEARQAFANGTTVGQNWVVIDSENNIGWFPYNRLPKRTWATNLSGAAPPWLPLDGSSGDYEWDEYFTLEELPQLLNPESGYIATANNDMTGALFDGDPTTLRGTFYPPYQVSAAAGFRHKQIVNLIESFGDQHSRDTMNQIQSDVYSLIGERMVPKILEIAKDTTPGLDGMRVISALENWTNFTCPTGLAGDYTDSELVADSAELLESSGCTAFHVLYNQLRARIEWKKNAPEGRKPSFAMYYSIVDPTQLAAGDIYWDDPATTTVVETKLDVMTDALRDAGQFLYDWLGDDETKWAWGQLHGLQLSEDLSSFGVSAYDNPAPGDPLFANDGGLFTVDVANPTFNADRPSEDSFDPENNFDFTQTAGPSTRFVCEESPNGPTCTIQLPGGQSSDINSPHYEDLLFPWLHNEPMPLVFDIAQVAADPAAETVTFE